MSQNNLNERAIAILEQNIEDIRSGRFVVGHIKYSRLDKNHSLEIITGQRKLFSVNTKSLTVTDERE